MDALEPVTVDLHREVRGDGEPLLLLHGFMGCGANWRLIFPETPAGFRLIAPDLRGHGRSMNPRGVFSFRAAGLDVVALLDRLEIDRAKAIGVSGGAQVLLQIATTAHSRLSAIVLVSGAHYFPEQARAIMRQTTPEGASEEVWRQMRSFHPGGEAQILALWRQAHDFANADDPHFTPAQLAGVRARTLIVHGDADPFYPMEVMEELRASIPGAQLWVVPGAGHGPIFGAQTAPFLDRALAFLREPCE
jgi:pimeloyl-ACP methyl ester carboxylesterase